MQDIRGNEIYHTAPILMSMGNQLYQGWVFSGNNKRWPVFINTNSWNFEVILRKIYYDSGSTSYSMDDYKRGYKNQSFTMFGRRFDPGRARFGVLLREDSYLRRADEIFTDLNLVGVPHLNLDSLLNVDQLFYEVVLPVLTGVLPDDEAKDRLSRVLNHPDLKYQPKLWQ